MKKFNKKSLLLSSALIAGLIFTVSSQVKADTTDNGDANDTNVLQISHNNAVVPARASISPVASRDNQTLRQVAAANNTSLDILEKLNIILIQIFQLKMVPHCIYHKTLICLYKKMIVYHILYM